jgi:hypothetical protein
MIAGLPDYFFIREGIIHPDLPFLILEEDNGIETSGACHAVYFLQSVFYVVAGEEVLHTKDIDVDVRQDKLKERSRTPNPRIATG